MHPYREPWPPTGIQALRRHNPAGEVRLPAIAEHRLSLHLSPQTLTTCRESGRQFQRRRGHVDLTPAHCVGGFEAREGSDSIELRIPVGFLETVAERTFGDASAASLEARHLIEEARLTCLLLAIDAEQKAAFPGGRLYLDSLGTALAVQLLAEHAVPSSPEPDRAGARQLQRAIDFIEANLERPLSLPRLAAVVGLSSSGLQRGFRTLKGESVHRYVVRRRVERAKELLLKRVLPPAEVALAAGFSHQSHMARWMRRLLGVVPRELTAESASTHREAAIADGDVAVPERRGPASRG